MSKIIAFSHRIDSWKIARQVAADLRLWAECDQSHEDPGHVLIARHLLSEMANSLDRALDHMEVQASRACDKKSDELERDELQRQLDTMRDVTREFRDERDEWKAKAKKRDFKDEMADLLFRIQIPLNVQREYLKKVSQDSEMDSRERLEAEIRYEYNGSISNEAEQIIEWLDRQAAITTQECNDVYGSGCEACRRAQKREIAELEADNDYLRDCNKKLDYEVRDWKGEAKTQRNNFEQATEARKHWQRKYESVKAERDRYREKLMGDAE